MRGRRVPRSFPGEKGASEEPPAALPISNSADWVPWRRRARPRGPSARRGLLADLGRAGRRRRRSARPVLPERASQWRRLRAERRRSRSPRDPPPRRPRPTRRCRIRPPPHHRIVDSIDGVPTDPTSASGPSTSTPADGTNGPGTAWSFAQTGIDGGPLAVDTVLLFDLVEDSNAPAGRTARHWPPRPRPFWSGLPARPGVTVAVDYAPAPDDASRSAAPSAPRRPCGCRRSRRIHLRLPNMPRFLTGIGNSAFGTPIVETGPTRPCGFVLVHLHQHDQRPTQRHPGRPPDPSPKPASTAAHSPSTPSCSSTSSRTSSSDPPKTPGSAWPTSPRPTGCPPAN